MINMVHSSQIISGKIINTGLSRICIDEEESGQTDLGNLVALKLYKPKQCSVITITDNTHTLAGYLVFEEFHDNEFYPKLRIQDTMIDIKEWIYETFKLYKPGYQIGLEINSYSL